MLKMLFVVLTGIFLMGCTGTVTVTDTGPTRAEVRRQAFHQVIDTRAPSLVGVPNRTLEDFAVTVCDALDAGVTLEDVFMAGLEEGASPREAGTLVGASIAWKCPEYKTLLDSGASL